MIEVLDLVMNFLGWIVAAAVAYFAYDQWRDQKQRAKTPNSETGASVRAFHAANYQWVEERSADDAYERLLRELVGLDYASVPGLNQATEGLPEQWAPIFAKSKTTWRLIVNADGMVVAYWSFFFVTDGVIEKLRDGSFLEGSLSPDQVLAPTIAMRRPAYVSMLTVHPVLERNNATLALLYESMLETVDTLKSEGIEITDVYASAFTDKGAFISADTGMARFAPLAKGPPLFIGAWGPDMRERLQKRIEAFRRLSSRL